MFTLKNNKTDFFSRTSPSSVNFWKTELLLYLNQSVQTAFLNVALSSTACQFLVFPWDPDLLRTDMYFEQEPVKQVC